MTGIIDVGGGLRGIFGAGALDYCMDRGIHFDYCIGVSAGSANLISFVAGQRGRNYRFYTEYSRRREYMSLRNLLRRGSYIDLDYIYGSLSRTDGEYPLDYASFRDSPTKMKIVAANALTGETVYFDRDEMSLDDYFPLMASSSLPVVNKPYTVNGVPYYDGGIADPIPLAHAFADGCDRVVVILTRPRDYRKPISRDLRFARLMRPRYPKAARLVMLRSRLYNDQLEYALGCEKQGRALIVAPDDTGGLDTLTKDKNKLDRFYRRGYAAARAIDDFIK